jgi:hypothetical protein
MIDFDQAAARMFGSTTPTSAPASSAPASSATSIPSLDQAAEEMAERLFGKADDQAQAKGDTANTEMFSASIHADALREIEASAMQDHFASPDDARQTAAQWGQTFNSFELNASESASLAQLGASALARPPGPELVQSWTEQSRDVLLQEAGPQGAAQALADVQLMVQRFGTPELRDMLEATGLGNHPVVVRMAIQKAKALRNAGKLR